MAITVGQINIWRYCVRVATRDAMYQHIPLSELPSRYEFFNVMRRQVHRATFCAKLDGFEYCVFPRLKR